MPTIDLKRDLLLDTFVSYVRSVGLQCIGPIIMEVFALGASNEMSYHTCNVRSKVLNTIYYFYRLMEAQWLIGRDHSPTH